MKDIKIIADIQKVLKIKLNTIVELAGLSPFRGKVHKCNNYSQKTKVEKKQSPKYRNIINSHW